MTKCIFALRYQVDRKMFSQKSSIINEKQQHPEMTAKTLVFSECGEVA
jgi:hypothetical protein